MSRVSGFLVTAKFFLPYDPTNLDDIASKAQAVKAATKGDLSQLVGAVPMSIGHKVSSMDPAEILKAQGTPAPANEGAQDAGENAGGTEADGNAQNEPTTPRKKAAQA